MIRAVLFDLIGTTVKTSDTDFVLTCFKNAFLEHGTEPDIQFLKSNRGKSKLLMIQEVLIANGLPFTKAHKILDSFNHIMHSSMNNFSEAEGLKETFAYLSDNKIYIGIGTGLPESLFVDIFNHLGWGKYKIDYIGIAEKLGISRPEPGMIKDMMCKLSIHSPVQFLKVGDTVADIQEGKNASVQTAVVLAGTQTEEVLLKEKPGFVLHTLTDILQALKNA